MTEEGKQKTTKLALSSVKKVHSGYLLRKSTNYKNNNYPTT